MYCFVLRHDYCGFGIDVGIDVLIMYTRQDKTRVGYSVLIRMWSLNSILGLMQAKPVVLLKTRCSTEN